MANVEKTIKVQAPLPTVYNRWTRTIASGGSLRWVAAERNGMLGSLIRSLIQVSLGGTRLGPRTQASSHLRPLMRIPRALLCASTTNQMTFIEAVGGHLGFMSRKIEGHLKRFKEFIEERGVETGAWRGSVPTDRQ